MAEDHPTIKQLKKLKHLSQPDASWVKNNRAHLMRQIDNAVGEEKAYRYGIVERIDQWMQMFMPKPVLQAVSSIGTLAIVLAVATAGGLASVSASYKSLPGDMLWNVKVAAEKTTMVFSNKEERIQKNLEFAERRVDEIKRVVKQKDTKSAQRISVAKKELKKSVDQAVETAQEEVKAQIKDEPGKAVQLAKAVKDKADEIATELKTIKEDAQAEGELAGEVQTEEEQAQAKEVVDEIVKEVDEAVAELADQSYKPVEAVIDAVEAEEADGELIKSKTVVSEEITKIVTESLETILVESQKVQEGIDTTSAEQDEKELETVETPAIELTSSTPAVTETATASSTPDISLTEDVIQDTPIETLQKAADDAQASAKEAQELIAEGKLDEALDKIIEADQKTVEVEELLYQTIQTLEEEQADRVSRVVDKVSDDVRQEALTEAQEDKQTEEQAQQDQADAGTTENQESTAEANETTEPTNEVSQATDEGATETVTDPEQS